MDSINSPGYEEYSFSSSSAKAFLMASLLILRAAVTRPDSGVHGSERSLIFPGISNFSKRAFFASCKFVACPTLIFHNKKGPLCPIFIISSPLVSCSKRVMKALDFLFTDLGKSVGSFLWDLESENTTILSTNEINISLLQRTYSLHLHYILYSVRAWQFWKYKCLPKHSLAILNFFKI